MSCRERGGDKGAGLCESPMREMRTISAQAAIVAGELHRSASASTGQIRQSAAMMAAASGDVLCKRGGSIVDAFCARRCLRAVVVVVWMGRSGKLRLAMRQGCLDLGAGSHQPQDRAGHGRTTRDHGPYVCRSGAVSAVRSEHLYTL
jgi:hypothetical protein